MSDPRIDALAERIIRLEKQNARLKWAGGSMSAAMLVLLILAGAAPPPQAQRDPAVKAIRARNFTAVDSQGRGSVGIVTDVEPKAGGLIEFLDKAGRRRLALGLGEGDVPFVRLTDPDRGEEITLDLQGARGMGLSFRNKKRDSGILLGTGADGVSGLGLIGPGGKYLVALGINPDGTSQLIFRDKDGKELLQIPRP